MKSVKQYEITVRNALKLTNRYNKALEIQIHTLASALRTLDIATNEIDNLDMVTVRDTTGRTVPNPAFKIQRDAQDSITRQMKALGLTVDALDTGDESDSLVDLTKQMINSGKEPTILHPDDED